MRRQHAIRWASACAAALLAAVDARAQLHWETRQIEIDARLGQKRIEGQFRFHNTGRRPVTLFGLDDGCGCFSSNLVHKSYGPGERGEFTLGIETDGTSGRYCRFATLRTDDPYQAKVFLAIMARIPEAVDIRPPSLQWRVGEPPLEKSADIILADAPGVSIESIACDDPRHFALRTEGHGRQRRIVVHPIDTAGPAQTVIRIDVRIDANRRQTYRARASVIVH